MKASRSNSWTPGTRATPCIPHIESYPKVSEAEGQAVLQVLYDEMSPEETANSGAEQVNSIPATSG